MEHFSGKNIAITGACGTVGEAILARLLSRNLNVNKIIALDNSESAIFNLVSQYQDNRVNAVFTDIRDYNSLLEHFSGIDVLFHCAAMKHVNICENSPIDAIKTNVLSTQNVIDASVANNVSEVVFSSSDKAVNPTNVLGASKLLGEKLIAAAHKRATEAGTKLMSVRFGNILGSSGSVFHVFKNQIKNAKPITLTNNQMSRFIMTQDQAIDLIIGAPNLSIGGDVLVLKMPSIFIRDLALAMDNLFCKKTGREFSQHIEEIGASFGEKIYEELLNIEEISRTVEHDKYFQVLPVGYISKSAEKRKPREAYSYNSGSEEKLTINEIENLIEGSNLNNWWKD